MKKLKRITAVFAAIAMLLTAVPGIAADSGEEKTSVKVSDEYTSFDTVSGYVTERYINDSITKDELMQMGLSNYLDGNDELLVALLKATLSSLDKYSAFYTAEEYQEFENSVNKTFYGIGISMRQEGDYVVISDFVPGNKAEQAGFKIGDKIVRVDGTDVVGWSTSDVRNKIVGDVNTKVAITVLRGEEYIDLIGERTKVRQETVSMSVLDGNVAYIKISSFGSGTTDEFRDVLEECKERGVKKQIMLDLRDNPGGLLTSATNIARMIVPKGKIIDVKYRQSEYDMTYESDKTDTEYNFIVLVNGNTASSAEILASAIQDSGIGRLLGTQTYGKAVVQGTYPLNNGSVFKLTIGQYITRNGKEINNIGLTPDIQVENDVEKIDSTQFTSLGFKRAWSLGNSGDSVKAAKERLYYLGLYSGNIQNNVFRSDLREAIKSFQLTAGLVPSGILDIPTQVKLEEDFEKIEVTNDNQFEEAYILCGGTVSGADDADNAE